MSTDKKQSPVIPNLSIYPNDVIDLPRPQIKSESTPYIQPYVTEMRQAVQRTSAGVTQSMKQSFAKLNTHWLHAKSFLHSENLQLSLIGISSSLGTLLLVRKRKLVWRYSIPVVVGVSLTGYAYVRKEWNKFDMYSNIIALQRRTPEEAKVDSAISTKIDSNSENN